MRQVTSVCCIGDSKSPGERIILGGDMIDVGGGGVGSGGGCPPPEGHRAAGREGGKGHVEICNNK